MPTKRYESPDAVLTRVIKGLERSDHPLGGDDAAAETRVVLAYRTALIELLAFGPLACSEALTREGSAESRLPSEEVVNLRAELLQFLRSAVRRSGTGTPSTSISQYGGVTFAVRVDDDGRAGILAAGSSRALVLLQLVMLLDIVGLDNVRICSAPDCPGDGHPAPRLYVKTYRREFCSVRCQKRVYARRARQEELDRRKRQARAKRLRATR
jgi:hypothetical protein